MSGRIIFNPKRRIFPAGEVDRATLEDLAEAVQYGGNPQHKRVPGDFGLTPPAAPSPKKTWCDETGVFKRAIAKALVQEGLRRGLVSRRWPGKWPQNIWSVSEDGEHVFEAQLDSEERGSYHGYPMPSADPLRGDVLKAWSER